MCVHCIDLLPYLKSMYDQSDLAFYIFSDGTNEDHAEMADYFKWGFPIILMEQEEMKTLFNITTLPFVLITDQTLKVVSKGVIYNDSDYIFHLSKL
ncbi:alkyl hydroperoxide reductase [Paenibacillus elgii]|uniref:Alkyl hydroperoxide reductase n=2 Tax=Paenibacillus elgii TaxID=189691 RepID=A0A2T6FSQ2_9BACL|nr:alkyl hydroperoxide reductase [Paenibacillus elgii]